MMTSRRLAVVLGGILTTLPAVSAAQIPDKFMNLKVLPQDVSRAELVRVMRGFAGALGVRCNHCHVGDKPDTLEDFDFASDTKEEKRIARGMMRMTREINERLLPATERPGTVQVECVTCHRGMRTPETLLDVLIRAVERSGTAGAIAQYQDLRTKYYGRGGYDFGPPTLNMLAEWLARDRKDAAAAIEVQQFNVKVNPDIATSYSLLGDLYLARGDRAAARASFERALALDPSSDYYRKRIGELKP